jgi:tripartite-type tricarboxylate transporter receptor subunit TctC
VAADKNLVAEFLACAKANPDKLSMSSAGNGSVGHLSGIKFAGAKFI